MKMRRILAVGDIKRLSREIKGTPHRRKQYCLFGRLPTKEEQRGI